MSFADIPVDVGVVYEGERVRKEQMFVELGGPDEDHKFELLLVKPMEEVEDGKVEVVGPDLKDLPEGEHVPFGVKVEVAGEQLERDLEGVFERRIHDFFNYIQGVMHLNQRDTIWLRVAKSSVQKGLDSFRYIGLVLQRMFKAEFPIIEKAQVTFYTDPKAVEEQLKFAREVYEARDARVRGMRDEDVDEFYGCTLCQSFAPTNVCIITPQRYAACGAISWLDARASARINPSGPNFPIPKGECKDPDLGWYTGVDEAAKKYSMGEIEHINLYSLLDHPPCICGCFEAVAFYIPEVDGIGIVHRDFKGVAVNGLPFSTLADQTAGGRQVPGFNGISIEYMRSSRFFKPEGGWSRVVWLPKAVKERVKDAIPPELYDKIATEEDATNLEELKEFLKRVNHPVVERWPKEEEEEEVEEAAPPEAAPPTFAPTVQVPMQPVTMPAAPAGPSFKISFKNVRVRAEKLVFRKLEEEKKKK